MSGTLQRLFTFAKAAEKPPLENFTTEALAAAIRRDPSVFVAALADMGAIAEPTATELLRVETQVCVSGGGVVDLMVEFVLDGRPRSFWVEVKAHANLHGLQLHVYQEAAKAFPQTPKPTVLMLCKRPITDMAPTLRWNGLRSRIGNASHLYWQELRTFLEDQGMADDFDAPITPAELGIVPAAHGLLRKTARMAFEFLSSLPEGKDWQKVEFPDSENAVVASIAQQFRKHRRLMMRSKRYPRVNLGLTFEPTPHLALWIEFRQKDDVARNAVLARARAGHLPEVWLTPSDRRIPLRSRLPVEGALDQERALGWLSARFDELDRAGVFAELPQWRLKNRPVQSTDDDDEGD